MQVMLTASSAEGHPPFEQDPLQHQALKEFAEMRAALGRLLAIAQSTQRFPCQSSKSCSLLASHFVVGPLLLVFSADFKVRRVDFLR